MAVHRTAGYASVLAALRTMFDQIGGIGGLVSGKTVAIKINMTGPVRARTGGRAGWYTRWTHPAVLGAAVSLIGQAGAARIRILEGSSENDFPLEENFLMGGWDPAPLLEAAPRVEMENTGALGKGREYNRLEVPGGGLVYPGFDFNHSYKDCDVLVSLAKLKEHQKTGVSLSMKNMAGAPPGAIYGDSAGYDAPAARPFGARTMFHTGNRQPPEGTPPEKDPGSPREYGYRVPRIIVDIVKARPIDLAIIDGIETQTASAAEAIEEGAKREIRLVRPGILIAGRNPVCVDAVAMSAMGFDPLADRGTAPFENGDSTLKLAEEAGIGTRDLGKIEIAGAALRSLRFLFRERG
ncbi:MAG: DUF362 domain-containing protein [Acidobacteriia bacterium]|nr:DUF362 domain-containing protein [Terriglobia bacterium]